MELKNHEITEWPRLEGTCGDHPFWILKSKFRALNEAPTYELGTQAFI